MDLMDYLAKTEGNYLHRVAGERFPTSAYGIHFKSHQNAPIWGFYKAICKEIRIKCDLSNKHFRDRVNSYLNEHQDLKLEERGIVRNYYITHFISESVSDLLKDSENLALISMSILVGRRRGIMFLQQTVGAKVDGIAGDETLSKMDKFNLEKFLDYAWDYLDILSSKEKFSKYRNGWKNRVDELRPKKAKRKKPI